MEKLVIDRTCWLRGEGGKESYLLRETDGKMCCLGFYAIQHGYVEDEIRGTTTPMELEQSASRMPELVLETRNGLGVAHTEVCNDLMADNDDDFSEDESVREERISRLFAQIGTQVEFIN